MRETGSLQVLSVASEMFPLIKTGGLADVAGALPAALARDGVSVRTLLPGYPAVLQKLTAAKAVHEEHDLFGGRAKILAGEAENAEIFVLDAPHLYDREGNPYSDAEGRDWHDNGARFAALARMAAAIGLRAVPGFRPDVVHVHDWQGGLTPAYLHYAGGARPGTVITVHNLAFQGVFPAELFPSLGLPDAAFGIDGVEYYGSVGFLKAGLQLADRITTVSPTYAQEISAPGGGMGLEGVLQARAPAVSGILNGIDEDIWNPATDRYLASRFAAEKLDARGPNKLALQARVGLEPRADTLLFGVVSRLFWQKGLDLLLSAIPHLIEYDAQLVLLGSGDGELERGFRNAAKSAPGRIAVSIGYDEALAHLIQGGADALLVPSRFEPCGLTQLYAMRYGALPVVGRVGGLNDTIIDANEMARAAGVATGFQFAPVTKEALEAAIDRVFAAWRDRPTWRRMQLSAMRAKVGWSGPAAKYAELYRSLVAVRRQ